MKVVNDDSKGKEGKKKKMRENHDMGLMMMMLPCVMMMIPWSQASQYRNRKKFGNDAHGHGSS